MTVTLQPRKINNTVYEMPTVNGMDRTQINTRLHYINEELSKIKAKQAALIAARDQLDRHNEMQEMGDLFDEMFGGWLTWKTIEFVLKLTTDVWLFGMRNPKQSPQTNLYSIGSTINSVD